GSQLGILVSGPEALESTRSIDTVVLDKTGTLTTGVMSLAGTELSAPDFEVLARLESRSEHPIARAILAAAPAVVGATATPGATAETAAGNPAESTPAAGSSAEITPAAGNPAESTPAAETKAEASGSALVESAEITDFENIAGGGLRATIDGADVLAGRPGLL